MSNAQTKNEFDTVAKISDDADESTHKSGLVGFATTSFILGYLKSKLAIAIKLGKLTYEELNTCEKEIPIVFLKHKNPDNFYRDVIYVVIKKLDSGEFWCQGFKGADWHKPETMNPLGSTKQDLRDCEPIATQFEIKDRWIKYYCDRRSGDGGSYITGSPLDIEGCIFNLIQAKQISPNQ